MKITKKLLMKIIKEELVREAQREVWDYDQSNFTDRRGRPDHKAYEQHLDKKRKHDPYHLSKEVNKGQYDVSMGEGDVPPLPPATKRDIRNGKLEEETDYYKQRVYFYPEKGTWQRVVYSPGSSTIIHEDRGNIEDYPKA